MSTLTPHWFQAEAQTSIIDFLMQTWNEERHPVVAMPTGTGKSVVIALLCKYLLCNWPKLSIICLTHIKELIQQNSERAHQAWTEAPIGVYSAGLRRRDTAMPLTFAGVASVHGRVPQFGWQDFILIDEAHLLSPNDGSMYRQVIADFKKINPQVKVIGFTATPYRLGQGLITDEGGLFTDVCYDVTGLHAFNRLIAEGFMSPLVTKKTHVEIDTSELSVARGDFKVADLERAVNSVTLKACEELCARAADRRSWMVFAPGIENTLAIAELLNRFGVPTVAVHSKMKDAERNKAVEQIKSFAVRCVVNNNILTTGFDHPALDCIAMMRPTLSPGLWVQMLGRGTRVAPEKQDCLVLDFAGNTRNLGPINDPRIPKRKGAGGGDAPVRICPGCGTYNHASLRSCFCCGMDFDFTPNIVGKASSEEVLRSEIPVVETLPVAFVTYQSYTKKGGVVPCLKVTYSTGIQHFTEYIHLQAPHASEPGKIARDWWRTRHAIEPPATVQEALSYQYALKVPKRIRVIVNRPYTPITGYEYD